MVSKPREVQTSDLAKFLAKYERGQNIDFLPQEKQDFYALKADSILTFISIFENKPKKR